MPRVLLALFLSLAALGRAGNFEMQASVDRHELELGESLQLRVSVDIQGQLDFQPQLQSPNFDGFEAHGPSQQQNVAWVNGAMSMSQALVWDLTAVKAGKLTLGPFVITAKDAKHGDIRKEAPAIVITVKRPKGLKLNAPQPQAVPTLNLNNGGPQGDDQTLRDIKPDRALPWAWIAGGSLLFLAALVGVLTWWRRKPQGPPPIVVPRDPGQFALEQLEKARQGLVAGGERDFVLAGARLLRDYLRHRLRLADEVTLGQALRMMARRSPELVTGREAGARLDLLVFGGVEVQPADSDWAYEAIRAYIILCEQHWPRPTAEAAPAPSRRPKRSSKTPQ
jgi:hypothetical protein